MNTYNHYSDAQPWFSIIIPVYNAEECIKQCLDSIINQTFKNYEIICIDNGSTDNSQSILEEYAKKDKRFKIISPENPKQDISRNNGIDLANGKYLLFISPDNWIEANTLELIYNKVEKYSAGAVQFDYKIFNNSKKTYKKIKHRPLSELDFSSGINPPGNEQKAKLFENKKINSTTRVVSILGIQIYKTEDNERERIQHILGNFIYTKKIKSKIKELKIFKILGFPISKRIIEDDICSYYCLGKLVSRHHLADLFFKNKLKKIKYNFDDIYILHSNSGEIYLFFAYLAKAFLRKNNSKKPLFVATQKYHIDILKLYYPEARYIYIPGMRFKTQSHIWKTRGHTFYILFSGNHFTKVEEDIKNQEIGQVHYLKSILKTLNLTENDFYKPIICDDIDLETKLNNKVSKINLKLNSFIIIAPEAMTCSELPRTFWIKLAQKLQQNKYDIYLNITDKANSIPECKTLDLSYRETYFLAKKAKAVISLRSGLSEFLIPTNTPNIAIYTKFRKCTKNAFPVDKGLEGFSMLKMPFIEAAKICEINADNYKDEDTLLEEVMSQLNKMLSQKEGNLV